MRNIVLAALAVLALLAVMPLPASAQNTNGIYSGTAQTLTYIQQQYVLAPLPSATITVCNYPAAQPSPTLPCSNLAQLYAGPTISTPAASAFAADTQGNFSFWALPGYYAYTVTDVLTNVTSGPYAVVISSGTSGGGGGATFPYPGIVFATNSIAGTVATSTQIAQALNLSPSTLLAPALLPIATSSILGAVRPDGTSITINPSGIISATLGAATIPSTTLVLKGGNVSNVAAVALPGTDYVIPSGSVASLSAASTLPNGTVATTQPLSDNTTKLATDAFVLANAGLGNPMTTAGDLIVAGAAGAPTRLPGNTGAMQAVLTSTAGVTAGPTAKSCANASGGAGNSLSCTWSTAPAAGEFLACAVTNGGTNTFTLSDSASDTYTNYGAGHLNSTTNSFIQTFYFGPVTTPVTAATVTVPSGGSILTILCNSVTGIASSPTDGQAVADSTSAPFSSGAITTTQNGDYIFCSGIGGGGSGFSAGSGFTTGAQHSPFFNSLNEYQLQSIAGAITPTMGGSVATGATLMCSAFKAASTTPITTAFNSTINIANAQAANTPVIPVGADPTGVSDSYAALQAALTLGISEGREVLIPVGDYITSAGLVCPTTNCRIRGAGTGQANHRSYIKATCSSCNTLTVGPGTPYTSPNGWVKDIVIGGNNSYTSGFSSLQINGGVQFSVENVSAGNNDICFDLTNNNYGAQFKNNRALAQTCNVGLNLRAGPLSGSDLYFTNNWLGGSHAAVQMSPNGGGYHFVGGQLSGQTLTTCDTCGTIIGGKDYLTGATGIFSADFSKISLEATTNMWAFRTFGQVNLVLDTVSINGDGGNGPLLGVIKSDNFGPGHLVLKDLELEGSFTNAVGGCPLAILNGTNNTVNSKYLGLNIREEGTNVDSNAVICGTNPSYVQSILAQSGIQQAGHITGLGAMSVPGNTNSIPVTLINDNAGNLGTSPSTGCFTGGTCVVTPVMGNPGTSLGDLFYQASTGKATRLAGNINVNDKVLVSHGIAQTVPTTKTCATYNSGGAGNSATCTWSTALAAGEAAVCGVGNFNGGSSTMTMTDSASNTYTAYGSPFTTLNPNGFSQTFYTAPLAGSVTTTTVNSPSGNFLSLQCNSFNNMAVSSPTDGQASQNSTSSTTIPNPAITITTTAAGDYVFCSLFGQSGATYTPGAGFTLGSSTAFKSLTEYAVQLAAGAISPTVTQLATQAATFTCSAFKPLTGTGIAQAPTLSNAPALDFTNMAGPVSATSVTATSVSATAGSITVLSSNSASIAAGLSAATVTSVLGSEESVASSTTPTFSTAFRESTTVVTANITTFTLAAGLAGQEKTLTFCQNGTGGFTVAPPANVHGFMTVGTTASLCSSQHFTYNFTKTAWLADSPGVVNM